MNGIILAKSSNYLLIGEDEEVILCDKDHKKIAVAGDMYGNASDAYIDPQERFCLIVGCGLIKYELIAPFEDYQYDKTTSQWSEIGRAGDIIWCDHIKEVTDDGFEVVLDSGELIKFDICL